MRCRICSAQLGYFAQAEILGKYPIGYFRCTSCGFIHTEEPYWLDESYSDVITGSDIGLVSRNLKLAVKTQAILATWFDPSKIFLDFAAGYGLLVRLMRDAGYDFRWYDRYCPNLLTKGFEADLSGACKFELITAFEVFEHMQEPLHEIEAMARHSRNILFSTEIIPNNIPKPESWWYYGLEHGQHISFYSLKTLQIMADSLSLNFYTDGHSLHLFTEKRLPSALFKLSSCRIMAQLVTSLFRRKTLLLDDAKLFGCNLSVD